MSYELRLGDALETLRTLPDASVQCCVTSPPYYGLRDYGTAGQMGLERTPAEYIEKMVVVFAEVRRVLKGDGTLWVNMGDSYAGSGGAGGDYAEGGLKAGQPRYEGTARQMRNAAARVGTHSTLEGGPRSQLQSARMPGRPATGVLKPKDLLGVPWMLAFALRAAGWYLRQDIIWNKPNSMPESVTDRCTKAHEYIFLLAKSGRYYFDAEAVKETVSDATIARLRQSNLHNQAGSDRVPGKSNGRMKAVGSAYSFARNVNEQPGPGQLRQHRVEREDVEYRGARNRRSVWTVTTKPYREAHFATFPPDLIEPCILAGSREGDTVLDPFNGSGTTGAVSIKHGRNYIGIDINPKYLELSKRRFARVQIAFA